MAQLEHLKLWYAGKAKNWDLAAYELRQLTNSLAEAAVFYPAVPISNVTTMREPLVWSPTRSRREMIASSSLPCAR